MSCKQKRGLFKTFLESQFEVMLSLHASNKSEFFSRHLLRLSLKLIKFISFKQNRILMNTFVEPQFEVMQVYEFQTKTNLYQDIS